MTRVTLAFGCVLVASLFDLMLALKLKPGLSPRAHNQLEFGDGRTCWALA